MIIEEIQARDRPIRRGIIRLLLDPDRLPSVVESYYAIALRVTHLIGENRRAVFPVDCELEQFREAMSEENVVAEHKHNAVRADEVRSDQKRLRDPLRSCLLGVAQPDGPLTTVAEQPYELRAILRCRDDENIADPCKHQRR